MNKKIIITSTYDQNGGAFKAAYRLHQGLVSKGESSTFYCKKKSLNDPTIVSPNGNLVKAINYLNSWTSNKLISFSNASKNAYKSLNILPNLNTNFLNKLDAEVVNLHWIADDFIRIQDLPKIKARKVVWTLHDCWPFLGMYHHPVSDFKSRLDNIIQRKKVESLQKTAIEIVAPSEWIADLAQKSLALKDSKIHIIPNGFDPNTFKNANKAYAREILGLKNGKKYILLGKSSEANSSLKGTSKLIDLIQQWNLGTEVEYLVLGHPGEIINSSGTNIHFLGQLQDDLSLGIVFSAADVYIHPSLQENLSNMIIESIMCGTQVIAFDVGGNKEIVNKENGILLNSGDFDSILQAAKRIIEKPNEIHLERRFLLSSVVDKYLNVYWDN